MMRTMDMDRPRWRPLLALSALYTLAYLPLLFARGIYWDAWVWFEQYKYHDYAWIYAREFDTTRVPHYYALFRFSDLFSQPVLVMQIIVFCSWLISGLLLFYILRRLLQWSETQAFIVSAYYLIYPIFIVRFNLMQGYYSLANVFFFIASALLLCSLVSSRGRAALYEVFAILFFLLAFLMNSYPFFFALVLAAHIFIFAREQGLNWLSKATLLRWLRRYFYLVILPCAFVIFRIFFFAPYGRDADYNALVIAHPSLSVLNQMFGNFWGGLYAGMLWPLVDALSLTERKFFAVAVVIAALAVWYIIRRFWLAEQPTPRWYKYMLIAGGIATCIALLPYLLVGKTPQIYGYGFGLRHGLLLGLPAALLLVGVVGHFVKERFQQWAHVAILSLSVAFLWYNFFLLDMDWYKQQAAMHELPAILATVPKGSLLVFTDNAAGYNWQKRNIGRQEYYGWLDYLAGERVYFGVNRFDFDYNPLPQELANPSKVSVTIDSARTLAEPVIKEWLHLKWFELTHSQEELSAEAERILMIRLHSGGPTESASAKQS